jgi:hypothetical protein
MPLKCALSVDSRSTGLAFDGETSLCFDRRRTDRAVVFFKGDRQGDARPGSFLIPTLTSDLELPPFGGRKAPLH